MQINATGGGKWEKTVVHESFIGIVLQDYCNIFPLNRRAFGFLSCGKFDAVNNNDVEFSVYFRSSFF